eukprot:31532-Pelagococcus_subviridis.AAC.21
MPIADAEDVRDHAVPRAALHEPHQRLRRAPVRTVFVRVVQRDVLRQRLVLGDDVRDRLRGNEFDEPGVAARGEDLIGRQLQIQVLAFQQAVHQRYHLHAELVLPQVVAFFENHVRARLLRRLKRELQRAQRGLEHCALLRDDAVDVDRRVDRQRQRLRERAEVAARALIREHRAQTLDFFRLPSHPRELSRDRRQLRHHLRLPSQRVPQLLALRAHGTARVLEQLVRPRRPRREALVLPLDDEIPVQKIREHRVRDRALDEKSRELAVVRALVSKRLHELQEVAQELVVRGVREDAHRVPSDFVLQRRFRLVRVAPVDALEKFRERAALGAQRVPELPQQLLVLRREVPRRRQRNRRRERPLLVPVRLQVVIDDASADGPREFLVLALRRVL